MRSLVIVTSAAALALLALTAGPASGAVVRCKAQVYKNGPVYVTSAAGLTCAAAAKEQRRYKWTGKNTFRTPGGYSCKPSGRGAVGYQIRCAKGSQAYRIEFAD
jgi:hypothetical protein